MSDPREQWTPNLYDKARAAYEKSLNAPWNKVEKIIEQSLSLGEIKVNSDLMTNLVKDKLTSLKFKYKSDGLSNYTIYWNE